jgi:hypothetical protein
VLVRRPSLRFGQSGPQTVHLGRDLGQARILTGTLVPESLVLGFEPRLVPPRRRERQG